jgi:hypothetical protein
MTGQVLGFDWQAVYTRLEIHGLLTPDIDRKLDVCEREMIRVLQEAAERDEKNKK